MSVIPRPNNMDYDVKSEENVRRHVNMILAT
jgi:hypothetical protein